MGTPSRKMFGTPGGRGSLGVTKSGRQSRRTTVSAKKLPTRPVSARSKRKVVFRFLGER